MFISDDFWLFEGASILERKIKENPLEIYSITLEPTPKWNKIVITGFEQRLIEDVQNHGEEGLLSLYFESKKFCPRGGEVASISVLPCQHAVVIEFKDPAGKYAVVTRLNLEIIFLQLFSLAVVIMSQFLNWVKFGHI